MDIDEAYKKELLQREAMYKVADYFKETVEKKIAIGKIPVLIEGCSIELLFVDCDSSGVPKQRRIEILEAKAFYATILSEQDIVDTIQQITSKSIFIREPLLMSDLGFLHTHNYIYYMWKGEIMNTENIPLEDFNVSELMKIAQNAIQTREGLIINEAIKNKLIK